MKNLENKEILSDEIFNAISLIIKQTPNAVFGGSIALNAVGLINRPISDIDLFFGMNESLSKNGYLSVETIGEITSDTVTNTNGKYKEQGLKSQGLKPVVLKYLMKNCNAQNINLQGMKQNLPFVFKM